MPRLRPRRLHEGERGERHPDVAALDHAPSGLEPRAEERVRSGSEAHSGFLRRGEQGESAGAVERERLLAPHVLARGDGRKGHLDMRGRDGQVDHDLDIRMPERGRNSTPGLDAELARTLLGDGFVDIADRMHDDVGKGGEVLEILLADGAGTDEPDPDRAAHEEAPAFR